MWRKDSTPGKQALTACEGHMTERARISLALAACSIQRIILLASAGAAHSLRLSVERPWSVGPWWLDAWACWDSGWYFMIAKVGYLRSSPLFPQWYAFFPGYPAAIRFLCWLLGLTPTDAHLVAAGFFVSFLCSVLCVYLLHRITSEQLGESVALFTVLIFLSLPGAFFLAAVYSESLFICLVLLAFYFARRARWGLASLATAAATFTRPLGVILCPVLAYDYVAWLRREGTSRNTLMQALWLVASPAGLVAFSLFAWSRTSDPLMWGLANRRYWLRYLDWPWVGALGVLRSTLSPSRLPPILFRPSLFLDASMLLLFFFLAVFVFRLRRADYSLLVWLYLLTLLSSPSHSVWPWDSMKRYVLPLFPCFIVLGAWFTAHRKLFWVVLVFFLLVQCYFFAAFGLGIWVI